MPSHDVVRAARLVVASALCAALAACGSDSTAPGVVDGTYLLRAIGPSPVPAVASSGQFGSITVLSASLSFRGDRAVLKRRERWVDAGPGVPKPERINEREESYSYKVEGDRLIIGSPCKPDPAALCAYSESGKVLDGQLRMRVWYSQHEWVYEQVAAF